MNEINFFVFSFIITVVTIPFLISFSKKKNIFDFPEGDALKIHKMPISLFGGLAMLIATDTIFLFLSFWKIEFLFVTLAGLIIFALGFYDDLKWKHISLRKPYIKFFFLIFCSFGATLVLYFSGIKFYLFPILVGAGYIFVLINAINYQDGMDGQAGFLSAISFLGFCILSFISGNPFSLAFSLVFLGAVLGFLIYNFPPAKIFMGDSGAYLIGFSLALLAMVFSTNVLSHLLIIGLPLFDGVYSNIRRLLKGKSIFLGDREHFYDKMLNKGFSVEKTLALSCTLQIFFVISGIFVYIINI